MSATNGSTPPPADIDRRLQESKRLLELKQTEARLRRIEILESHQKKIKESYEAWSWLSGYSDLLDRMRGPDRDLLLPVSTANDRRYGANWPFWRSEVEHSRIRAASRLICQTSPLAQGILSGLTSYVVGPGFAVKATWRDDDKPDRDLLRAFQRLLDELTDANDFKLLQQELFRRSRRDGEFFLRAFPLKDGWTAWRTIEPEQVLMPPNKTLDEASFGILTDPDDIQSVTGYAVAYDGNAGNAEIVDARYVWHCKENVDAAIKRGQPDFAFETLDLIKTATRLLENLGQGAAIQAAIALVRQHALADGAAVADFVSGLADYQQQQPFTGASRNVQRWEAGTILDMDSGQQYVDPPIAKGASSFVEVVQALLRAIAVKWSAPEWITSGDASNSNYASAMVAESPFVRRCQRLQQKQAALYRRAYRAAVEHYCQVKCGLRVGGEKIDWERLWDLCDIHVTPPALEVRNKGEEASVNQTYVTLGIKSRQTAAQELGLKWDVEEANNVEFEAKHGEQGIAQGQRDDGSAEAAVKGPGQANDQANDQASDGGDSGQMKGDALHPSSPKQPQRPPQPLRENVEHIGASEVAGPVPEGLPEGGGATPPSPAETSDAGLVELFGRQCQRLADDGERLIRLLEGEWDEKKHPRDHGKFSSKPGGSGGQPSLFGDVPDEEPQPRQTGRQPSLFDDDDNDAEGAPAASPTPPPPADSAPLRIVKTPAGRYVSEHADPVLSDHYANEWPSRIGRKKFDELQKALWGERGDDYDLVYNPDIDRIEVWKRADVEKRFGPKAVTVYNYRDQKWHTGDMEPTGRPVSKWADPDLSDSYGGVAPEFVGWRLFNDMRDDLRDDYGDDYDLVYNEESDRFEVWPAEEVEDQYGSTVTTDYDERTGRWETYSDDYQGERDDEQRRLASDEEIHQATLQPSEDVLDALAELNDADAYPEGDEEADAARRQAIDEFNAGQQAAGESHRVVIDEDGDATLAWADDSDDPPEKWQPLFWDEDAYAWLDDQAYEVHLRDRRQQRFLEGRARSTGADDDPRAKAEAIARVLHGLFGKDALRLFTIASNEDESHGEADVSESYRWLVEAWNALDHPRGKNGRFIPKGSGEAVAAAKQAVSKVLSSPVGSDPASAQSVAEHLNILTVKQIRELARQHGFGPVPKLLKDDLVAAVLARLTPDEKGEKKVAPKSEPTSALTNDGGKAGKISVDNADPGSRMKAEAAQGPPTPTRETAMSQGEKSVSPGVAELGRMLDRYDRPSGFGTKPDITDDVLAFLRAGVVQADEKVGMRRNDPLIGYGSERKYRVKNARGEWRALVLWGNEDGYGIVDADEKPAKPQPYSASSKGDSTPKPAPVAAPPQQTPATEPPTPAGETAVSSDTNAVKPIHSKTTTGVDVTLTGVEQNGRPAVKVEFTHPKLGALSFVSSSYGRARPGQPEGAVGHIANVGPSSVTVPRADFDAAMAEAGKIGDRERADIRAGHRPIRTKYRDGEHLSGHQVFGREAEALVSLGLAKEVAGWGTRVNDDVIAALGDNFTYPQAAGHARPALMAARAKQHEAEQKRAAFFAQAKATGKPVEMSRHGEESDGSDSEISWDIVVRYAMPDGTVKTERIPTY